MDGDITLWPVHDQVLAYVRSSGQEQILCAFNLSDRAASIALPAGMAAPSLLADSGLDGVALHGNCLVFEPWGAVFARV
jgi:alpha-glucosidase